MANPNAIAGGRADFNKITWKGPRGSKLAIIAANAHTSTGGEQESANGVFCGLGTVVGMYVPADVDGVTIQFKVSIDDTNYKVLRDTSGDPVGVTISGSGDYYVPLEAADFHAWDFVQVWTVDGGGANQVQTAERRFVLIVARV